MKLLVEKQLEPINDEARARISMVLPVLNGLLFALQQARVERLGGHGRITLADIAREYREGSGDCGICFEYAVHDAIKNQDKHIHPILSEVLEDRFGIRGGAQSILFGAEKTGAIALIETPAKFVTEDARILAGNIGRPAKLFKNWEKIKKALHDQKAREDLPESIRGVWKSDLFIGNSDEECWVGTTLKINPKQFEGAPGLRVGVYPEQKRGEAPHIDEDKNLLLCPLPYNGSFMELFYSSFFIVKQFLDADARVPKPVALPNSSDRYVASLLEERREFPILEVVGAMAAMAQPRLLETSEVGTDEEGTPVGAIAPIAQVGGK